MPLLFVYGTLMEGLGFHNELDGSEKVGKGTIKGEMYAIKGISFDYPVLFEGDNDISGEIYRVSKERLKEIDWTEKRYNRKKVEVNGKEVFAYFYPETKKDMVKEEYKEVESGNFKEFLEKED